MKCVEECEEVRHFCPLSILSFGYKLTPCAYAIVYYRTATATVATVNATGKFLKYNDLE
jgi:hypothetical protein